MAPRDYNPADYDEWLWQQADEYMESIYGPDEEDEEKENGDEENEEG